MFLVTRKLLVGVPAAAFVVGLAHQPGLLVVPPAIVALFLLVRDRTIRNRIGTAPWASDGFARHALVDDLAALIGASLLALPLFFAGELLARTLQAS